MAPTGVRTRGGSNEFVLAGGTSTNTTLNGSDQYVYGSASGTVVSTGSFQDVLAGGTASSTTVNNGGIQYDYGTERHHTERCTEWVFAGGADSLR